MNGTALITAVPAIRHVFDLDPTTLQWIVTIYFLTGAIFLAAAGRLGDRFGLGRVFLAGALAFMVAFAMIALAPSPAVVLAGRALQGLAGALLLPMSLALVQATFPQDQRQLAVGIWSGVLGLGLGVGPIVGGLLTHYLDWRTIFWASLAITTVSFAVVLLAFRGLGETRPGGSREPQDYLGFVLLATSMGTLTFAITHARDLGWDSPVTLGTSLVAVAAFVALLLRERRVDNPFLNLSLFEHRRFIAATLGIFATFFLIYTILYFASIFIQNGLALGYTAEEAGFSLISLPLVMFAVSTMVHRAITRFGHHRVITTGMALICLGSLLLHLEASAIAIGGLEMALLVCGLGLGLTVPVFSGIGLESLPSQATGQGSGVLTTFTFLGGTLGISLGGVVSTGASRSVLADSLAKLQITDPAQLAKIEAGLHTTTADLNRLLAQFDSATAQAVYDGLQRAVDAGFAELTLLCVIVAGPAALAQYWLLKRSPD
jgi:EmrB/QacA subfamily drug resistance transporter